MHRYLLYSKRFFHDFDECIPCPWQLLAQQVQIGQTAGIVAIFKTKILLIFVRFLYDMFAVWLFLFELDFDKPLNLM